MSDGPEKFGALWSRDESILAFDLYCRIPFRKTKASNPLVRDLAQLLGRSPAAVARKLGNFGAFDPQLRQRNISGLTHTSQLDEAIWNEFHSNWDTLVLEAAELRSQLSPKGLKEQELLIQPTGASEIIVNRKQRIHQAFFREAVLSSYSCRCCITGISVPQCLIASHIIPWSANEHSRTDPTNGLCLSATFDRLFDQGLIGIDENMRVIVANTAIAKPTEADRVLILQYCGTELMMPHRFRPDPDKLVWHRENVFRHS